MRPLDQPAALKKFKVFADGDGGGSKTLCEVHHQRAALPLHDCEDFLPPFVGKPVPHYRYSRHPFSPFRRFLLLLLVTVCQLNRY